MTRYIFLVPCTGPDGKQYESGTLVPEKWDADYVRSLADTGGAKKATKADLKEAGEA